MMKKIIIFLLLFLSTVSCIQATQIEEKVGLGDYTTKINEYIKESEMGEVIDIKEISSNLMQGKAIDSKGILSNILAFFFKEVIIVFKNAISILLVIIVMSILKNLEIDEKSSIVKIANLVCLLTISIMIISTFVGIIDMVRSTITNITLIMQIVSPFLLTLLMASGKITTIGILQPLILFVCSFIGFIITSVIIPLLTISLSFSIVHALNDKIGFSKLGKLSSKTAVWMIGVTFTVFLGILSLETSVTTSIDSLAVKTASAAVSNFVPIVGKVFSDSFEAVLGATEIVGKVGGVIGILGIIAVVLMPIIKLIGITIVYNLLSAVSEPFVSDSKIGDILQNFADIYKTLLGVLIGVAILFTISIGIILNILSNM